MVSEIVPKDAEIEVEEAEEILALPLMRLDTIDSYDRMGYSVAQIVKEMLSDPISAIHFADITDRTDVLPQEQLKRVAKRIQGDLKHLQNQRQLEVTPAKAQEALIEYLGREDLIYRQAWMDHGNAVDYDTKIKALQVAQESARNKARALGVGVDKQTVTRKRSASIPIEALDSPGKLAELVNLVSSQMKTTDEKVLKLEEEVTVEGAGVDIVVEPDSQ